VERVKDLVKEAGVAGIAPTAGLTSALYADSPWTFVAEVTKRYFSPLTIPSVAVVTT
jgi:hypothetical protein